MPYLLRKYGMPVDKIAGIVAIEVLPAIWSFLWSPLADSGLRRRSWVIVSALGSGLAAGTAIVGIHGSPVLLTALMFLANAFAGLLSSSCGALLTAMPESLRGRSSGWYQAGNLGGGAIGGGLVIWLADLATLPIVALAIATATVLPALAAFLIDEPVPVRRAIGPADCRLVPRYARSILGAPHVARPGVFPFASRKRRDQQSYFERGPGLSRLGKRGGVGHRNRGRPARGGRVFRRWTSGGPDEPDGGLASLSGCTDSLRRQGSELRLGSIPRRTGRKTELHARRVRATALPKA